MTILPLSSSLVDAEQSINLVRDSGPFYPLVGNDDCGITSYNQTILRDPANCIGRKFALVSYEDYNGFCLFRSVDIKQGATILGASLTLEVFSIAGTVKLKIYGHKKASSTPPISSYNEYSKIVPNELTRNYTACSFSSSGSVGFYNLKDIIQEIINLSDWKRNNNIRLVLINNELSDADNYATIYSIRYALIYGDIYRAKLNITFTE